MQNQNNQNHLKISSISLINFRTHSNLTINLEDINILIGENGCGKSTVLEAICYCLFGAVANGAKKNELIKHGEKNGGVTIKFDNGYVLVRDFKDGVKLIDSSNKIITEKVNEVESYLNMNKDVFLNILYAAQNDIYSYFLKFNAKEKDFIDSIFNLDELTDNVTNNVKNICNELDNKKKDIEYVINNRKNLEIAIQNILDSVNMKSITELINAVSIAQDNLNSVVDKQNKFNDIQNAINKKKSIEDYLLRAKDTYSQLQTQMNNSKTQIQKLQSDLDNYTDNISKQTGIKDINGKDLSSFRNAMSQNCDVNNYINNITNYSNYCIQNIDDKDNVIKCLNYIIQLAQSITKINEYRAYYDNIINTINKMQYNIDVMSNTIDNYQSQLNSFEIDKKKNEEELSKLSTIDINNTNVDDINHLTELIRNSQSQYTLLSTTLNNLIQNKKQLDSLTEVDESLLDDYSSKMDKLNEILPLFNRDGFVSFLRKSLLKEISNNIGDSLQKFGFTKLLPTDIDDKSGALSFHGRLFRSLSGGEKTIVAILLRILYSRLIAPTMRLNILLLDEPASELDEIRIGYLRELLNKINSIMNMQIIMVTHDSMSIPENANVINFNTDF